MGLYARLSIAAKLATGYLVLITLMLISGGWALHSMSTLQSGYGTLLDDTYPAALSAKELNAEVLGMAQGIMAFAATRDTRQIKLLTEAEVRGTGLLKKLEVASVGDAAAQDMVKEATTTWTQFNKMVQQIIKTSDEIDGTQLVLQADNARNLGRAVSTKVDGLVTHLRGNIDSARAASLASTRQAQQFMIMLAAVSLAIALGVSILAFLSIARPLRGLANELRQIAQGTGDLTRRIPVRSQDELGALAESFNQMVAGLSGTVREVVAASRRVNDSATAVQSHSRLAAIASAQVNEAARSVAGQSSHQTEVSRSAFATMAELALAIGQISAGAQQQAHQVQVTTHTVSTMVSAFTEVADKAQGVSSAAQAATDMARKGARIIDDHLEGMSRIRDQVSQANHKVRELGEHGRRIGNILQVITEIASRTNLLALNAAIEAARAGEQGRGFAVVADEVRELAARSAASVQEIKTIVDTIQLGTRQAVEAIAAGTAGVEEGVVMGKAAGEALQQILGTVEETVSNIHSISHSVQRVVQSTNQVSRAVEEVAAITQEHSAATEQMAAGADDVTAALKETAAVSQSNNEVVEEVVAAMSEVGRSIGGMAGSAEQLTVISSQLQQLVSQFKV